MKNWRNTKARDFSRTFHKRRYKRLLSNSCVYCGKEIECSDHVPAIYEIERFGVEYFWKRNIPLVIVNCCNRCNGILGTKLHTLEERKEYIRCYLIIEDLLANRWRKP